MAESELLLHHQKQEYCATRPAYREGRKLKAVKVFTVNDESRYLIVQGVPAVGASQELLQLCALYGRIVEYRILDEYPTADQFTDVFWIKYEQIQSARVAKKKLDDRSFFGGVLHVCYAPECESVEETREKLVQRRKAIAAKCREYGYDGSRASEASKKGLPGRLEEDSRPLQPSRSLDGESAGGSDSAGRIDAPLAAAAPDVQAGYSSHASDGGEPGVVRAATAVRGALVGVALVGVAPTNYPSTECYPHEWPEVPLPAGRPTTAETELATGGTDAPTKTITRVTTAAAAAAVWQRHTFSVLPKPSVGGTRQSGAVLLAAPVSRPSTVEANREPAKRWQPIAEAATGGSAPQAGRVRSEMSRSLAGSTAPQQTAEAPLVVRQYRATTVQTPKFVPRQTSSRGLLSTEAVSGGHSRSIDAALKLNAAVLGKLQGPSLPAQATAQGGPDAREQSTLTGSDSMDKTVFDIRSRIRKALSAVTEASTAKVMKAQQPSGSTPEEEAKSATGAPTVPCM